MTISNELRAWQFWTLPEHMDFHNYALLWFYIFNGLYLFRVMQKFDDSIVNFRKYSDV